jgi:hypothetical protein
VRTNPHLFRDCLVTTIAIEQPSEILAAVPIPQHRRCATVMLKHYNQAGQREAAASYHEEVQRLKARYKAAEPDAC